MFLDYQQHQYQVDMVTPVICEFYQKSKGTIDWSLFFFAVTYTHTLIHSSVRIPYLDAGTSIELNWNWIQIFTKQMFSFGLSFVWLWLFDMLFFSILFLCLRFWWMRQTLRCARIDTCQWFQMDPLWSTSNADFSSYSFVLFIYDVYLWAHCLKGAQFHFSGIFFYDDFFLFSFHPCTIIFLSIHSFVLFGVQHKFLPIFNFVLFSTLSSDVYWKCLKSFCLLYEVEECKITLSTCHNLWYFELNPFFDD